MLGNATHERTSNEPFEHTDEEKKVDRCTQHCGKDVNDTSGKRGDWATRRVTRSMDEKPEEIKRKESREASLSEERKPAHNRGSDVHRKRGMGNCKVPGIGNDDREYGSILDGIVSANEEDQVNAEEKNGDQAVGDAGKVTQTKGRDRKTFRREARVKMESEESEYLKGGLQSGESSRGVLLSSSGPITRARQVKQRGIEMGAEVTVDSDRRRKAVMAHRAMQEVMEKSHSNWQQNIGANNVKQLGNMVETRRLIFPKGRDEKLQLGRKVRWARNWTQEKDVKHGHHIDGKKNTDSRDFGKVTRDQTSQQLVKHEQQQQKRRRFTAESLANDKQNDKNLVNDKQNSMGKESGMEVELAGPITRSMKRRVHAHARGWNKYRRRMNEQSDNAKGAVHGVDGKEIGIVPLIDTGQEQTASVLMEKTDNSTGRKLRSVNNIDAADEVKALNQPGLLLRDNPPMGTGLKWARDGMPVKENMLLDDIAVDIKTVFFRGSTSDEEKPLKTSLESAKNESFDIGEERDAGMQLKANFDESGQEPKHPKKGALRVHEGTEYVDGKSLKGESVSDTLEKASVIRLGHELLEPETIQTKVVKRGGLVATRAAERSCKGALAVLTNCVNQKLEEATGHDSGIVHVDTQKSCDNLLEVSADVYKKPASVHLNCRISAKELERKAHEVADFGKFRSGSMKHIESGMPPVFSISKEEFRKVPLGEVPIADKQNELQAGFREDHICTKSPVDDRNRCFLSSRRRMATMMNGVLRDSEVGNQFTHCDLVVDDGICRVDSKRKCYWVAANPKETGGRQMRPRPLDVDQPLPVLVEGFDQEYFTYDGGLFHRMAQVHEADWTKKNIENAASSDTVQAIVIPSYQVLPESQEQKRAKLEYVLPQSYVRYTEVAAERHKVFNCSGCNIYVHRSCYGIQEPVSGYESGANFRNNWYCRKCVVATEGRTAVEFCCALCHKKGGALKPGVDPSKWVHVVCALYTNETFFVNPDAMEPVDGVTAAEDRAKKQRRRCWFCGMGEGCREHCSVRGCNAIFHVSCGVNQGALFELKQSNHQVVGVRCFCATHANVALVSNTITKGEPEDRYDLVQEKRKRQSSWLRRKQREPLQRHKNDGEDGSINKGCRGGLLDSYNQISILREDNINYEAGMSESGPGRGIKCPKNHLVGKSPGFEESCKLQGLGNIAIHEKDIGMLLSLEEALKTDIAPSDDLEQVYAYWLSKRAKSNGSLLLRLQQEHAAETYGIFNKDGSEGDPSVSFYKLDPSRDGVLDIETVHERQQLAVVKQQLERLKEITKLVIQRERIKLEVYSVEQEIGQLKCETLGAKGHCSWCERTQHLLTCTICNSSFCFQCFRSKKRYGLRGWAVALKHHKFICDVCQSGEADEEKIHASEASFLKDKDSANCELGLGDQMREEEHGAVSCHNIFSRVCTRHDCFRGNFAECDVDGVVREEPSSGYDKRGELHSLLTRRINRVGSSSGNNDGSAAVCSTKDLVRKSNILVPSLVPKYLKCGVGN